MKILKFNEGVDIYHFDWKEKLPKTMLVIQGDGRWEFQLGNVMTNFDMVQVTYDSNIWGVSSTLQFDFYFLKKMGKKNFKMDIDITLGDSVVSEFSLESPNKVEVIQSTQGGSKWNPSGEGFSLGGDCLHQFIEFLNLFKGFQFREEDFNFLQYSG